MKISVVICTREGIPDKLKNSLKYQTLKPDEIIEIVGSSLTEQRNKGVMVSRGDLIMFLDDDVELEKDYIEKIVEVFYTYPDASAVTGNIVVKAFKTNILHRIFARVFLLSYQGQGKFLASGFPQTYDKHITNIIQAEVLHGCNMTIQKGVFGIFDFNERLEGGMFGEDDWFSYALSRNHAIYYTPFAICYDNREYPRGTQAWRTRCIILNLIKRWQENKTNPLAFWWSMVGFILLKLAESVIMRDFSITKGVWDACLCGIPKKEY